MIDLKELLKKEVEEIISSTDSLALLKYYSDLYLNGSEPRTCEKSLRKYYSQLKKDYQMKKQVIERTCVPAFEGRKYIPGVFNKNKELVGGHLHIMSHLITDEMATDFLKKGILKEKDFKVLPENKTESVEYTKENLLEVIEKDNYNKIIKVCKDLKLIEKKESKEVALNLLNEYVSKLD
jgi:hypothetical protein